MKNIKYELKQLIIKRHFRLLVILSFSLLIPVSLQAQIKPTHKNDTIKEWKIKLNPRLSPAFSAVVPGLGQIYNRKIWKVPIIYGGFYGLYYSWNYNNKKNIIKLSR